MKTVCLASAVLESILGWSLQSCCKLLLHNGPVQCRLNVILTIARVDHPLSFSLLFDFFLCEDLCEAHVRGNRLEIK